MFFEIFLSPFCWWLEFLSPSSSINFNELFPSEFVVVVVESPKCSNGNFITPLGLGILPISLNYMRRVFASSLIDTKVDLTARTHDRQQIYYVFIKNDKSKTERCGAE